MQNSRKGFVGVLLLAVVALLLAGTASVYFLKSENTPVKVTRENPAEITASSTDIYLCSSKKIGKTLNGRIFIDFDGSTYSFDGDMKGLGLLDYDGCTDAPSDWNSRITYDGLLINLPKKSDLVQVTYVCDAPLSGIIFEYCDTNGKDRISEYEFGKGYLGRNYENNWEKVFIKKTGGKNIVFEGILSDFVISDSLLYADKPSENPSDFNIVAVHWSDTTPAQLGVYPQELFNLYKELRSYNLVVDMKIYENKLNYDPSEKWFTDLNTLRDKMVRTFHSKAYLDAIKNEKTAKGNNAQWIKIIDSFRVEG